MASGPEAPEAGRIAFLQGNEVVADAALYAGLGFSLMQDAVGFAVMAEIPRVIVNVQRGGPSTGLPTQGAQADVMQARWGTHGDHAAVALTASNHQDLFRVTVEAFNTAETFRTPVILLLDEVIGHMREKLVVPASGEYSTTAPYGTVDAIRHRGFSVATRFEERHRERNLASLRLGHDLVKESVGLY